MLCAILVVESLKTKKELRIVPRIYCRCYQSQQVEACSEYLDPLNMTSYSSLTGKPTHYHLALVYFTLFLLQQTQDTWADVSGVLLQATLVMTQYARFV